MGKYKNKSYSLRIENELMNKVKALADIEDRPTNKQIERILREYIKRYEEENGTIQTEFPHQLPE